MSNLTGPGIEHLTSCADSDSVGSCYTNTISKKSQNSERLRIFVKNLLKVCFVISTFVARKCLTLLSCFGVLSPRVRFSSTVVTVAWAVFGNFTILLFGRRACLKKCDETILFSRIFNLVLYLSSYYEKANEARQQARLGVAAYLFTILRWGNPAVVCITCLCTTSKLAGLFSTLSL